MKKLHLVGFTPDNDGLILSPRKGAKTGGFVVSLDDDLLASIEDARRVREGGEPLEAPVGEAAAAASGSIEPRRTRPRSALSPREIQARLRAGSSIADVAAQAGVDEEWVLRFADPILAEQYQVVDSARRLTFVKSRRGPSAEPLGESVQWNLTDRGVRFSDDVFAGCWSAFNLHGARWAVRFTYTSRQRRQMAEWEVDLRERSLSARNRLASDLGHVEPGRRRPRLEPAELGQIEVAQPAAAARPRPATRTAPARRGAAAPAKKPVAKRGAAAKVAPAKKPVAKTSGREVAARKSRSAKKPAADKPGAPVPTPPVEPLPDRPSHLARPPSPMNTANRASSLPGRRLTAAYPAPPPSPPRQAPMRSSPASPPPERRHTERPVVPDDEAASPARQPPAKQPEAKQPAAKQAPAKQPVAKKPEAAPRPVAPPLRRPPPVVSVEGGDEQRPAVVILSNPPPSSRVKSSPKPAAASRG